MAVSGDSAAIKQMLNNMSSEELLRYYDGDSSISASLFNDRTFPFWAFLVLAAFILLFALLRLHAATPPANPTGSAAAQPSAKRPRMKLIAAIIAVLVVLAGTGFGLAARKLEWIGPRTVPTVRYRTAAEVSRELEAKGFLVKKKQMFNALGKGKCLGLVGVKAGNRLPKGTTVTVIESMGPGVPEGTVGSEPSKAETALLKMGVKVAEHEVVSEHPGKVAVTMPADGEPVRDTDDGIHIEVGITGDGIPVEIAGMDKDEAKTKLQQRGFDVTLKPRFSSRKNLSKIVRADPGIGVRTSETNVTLYYGVDASKRYDVVGTSIPDRGSDKFMTNTVALAGKYCTDGGNCLTLEPGQTDSNPSGLVLDGKGSSDFFDQLTLCTYSQDISGCNPPSGSYYNAMKDFLIQGDTGAMELYAGFGLPVCGTTSYVGDGPTYCDGTSEKQVEDGSDGTAEQAMSEKYLKYVARDFFVVMPVGADLDQLESNGYFDGSTTYKPYADRPYLIRRDNSAYPEIKATNDAFHRKPNPYAPGTNMQPFKKAPNAHNVYYLVEQPVDFSQFEGATVSGGRQGDGSDSSPDDGISSDGNGDDTVYPRSHHRREDRGHRNHVSDQRTLKRRQTRGDGSADLEVRGVMGLSSPDARPYETVVFQERGDVTQLRHVDAVRHAGVDFLGERGVRGIERAHRVEFGLGEDVVRRAVAVEHWRLQSRKLVVARQLAMCEEAGETDCGGVPFRVDAQHLAGE